MRIVHLSTTDIGGGAGVAAYRLHAGLGRIGVDSRMVVAHKLSGDERVSVLGQRRTNLERLRRRFHSEVMFRQFRRYRTTRPSYLDFFSDDRVPASALVPSALPQAGVYNLHWVAGFLDYRTFFGALPLDLPLVWTLHDMNPFTGGCHYTSGCDRFVGTCGECPALGSTNEADLSAAIFRRKKSVYERLDPESVRIVTPSAWLSREASRSALFSKFHISTIPYGLDTEMFQPRRRAIAREAFGIPQNLNIVMFAAQTLRNHRKGMDLLVEALSEQKISREIGLISVGRSDASAAVTGGYYCALGELKSERLMSLAYSAADLFVLPTREDNLPNVVLEAMACGTPVVAFDVGGLPDMIRPDMTGLLVPLEDVGGLRSAIATILEDDERRARISGECRRVAVERYRLEIQAERYVRLYRELMQRGDT